MATGVSYTDNIIVGDFACDIQSIVRYRGGFNWMSGAINMYYGYTFDPFTPLWINFTTREIWPWIIAWSSDDPITIDKDKNQMGWGFLYNKATIEYGYGKQSVTVIMKAREISMTALTKVTYSYNVRTTITNVPVAYRNLLTSADERTALMEKFPDSNFILD